MENLFREYNINVSAETLKQFEKYYRILIEYNNMFNITAITEKTDVYKKHFIDSILCGKLNVDNLIDIGSGGGFPAIPNKIMNPQIDLTLVEATGKKCAFLEAVVKELNLKNVKIINARAEDLAKDSNYREKFDMCSARAVAKLNTLLEYCLPFVKIGGEFIAFKGDSLEEVKEAQNALKVLGGKIESVKNLFLYDAKRDIIFVKKITSTPDKYPRGNGRERKNPL